MHSALTICWICAPASKTGSTCFIWIFSLELWSSGQTTEGTKDCRISGFVAIEQTESPQVLPKLTFDSDLYEISFKQHPIVLTDKPEISSVNMFNENGKIHTSLDCIGSVIVKY